MNATPAPGESWCGRLARPAEPARLPELMTLARCACEQADAPAQVEHDLLLLTEEACVNVMRHAYPPGAPGSITLQVRVSAMATRTVSSSPSKTKAGLSTHWQGRRWMSPLPPKTVPSAAWACT